MSTWYLDTSAALKLILVEPESEQLIKIVNDSQPSLTSSWLLDTELRRAAHRNQAVSQGRVSELLSTVDLVEVPASIFREAGRLPGPHLRSLDALHLAAAVSTGADAVVTYDIRMAHSASNIGLKVLSPA